MVGLLDNEIRLAVSRTSVAVTALAILQDDTILAAHSSYLVNTATSAKLKLFKHQAIHHLVCSTQQSFLLACGGRSVAIVDISSPESMEVCAPETRLHDWVVAAQWVGPDKVAVLFSYNSVTLLDVKLSALQSVKCDSCCIIYGGCIVLDNSEIVCCSGTVFNKPLLWKPFSESKGRVLKSYEGHSGVIFDIKLNQTNVFSVSDDRTLIVWDRETGDLVHRLYGHTARVLKVICLPDESDVVTVGEDNRCIIWSIKTGEKLAEYQPHTGYGIRSVAANGRVVATGGWDSRVVKYCLPEPVTHQPDSLLCSSLISFEGDQAKWLTWISTSEMLLQTASGRLVIRDNHLGEESEVISSDDSKFKDYSVFCKMGRIVVIGGISGDLCLFDTKLRTHTYVQNSDSSKVFSLTAVACSSSDLKLFLSCQDGGSMTLFRIQESCSTAESVAHFILPRCKNRWVTSAFLDESRGRLIVGDRKGGIHLFQHEKDGTFQVDPLFSIPGLHGDNGISQIAHHDSSLVTVGRDGNIRYLKIVDNILVITKKYKPLPAVFWVEQLEPTEWGTLLHYFHGQFFKVTVMETGETVFSVECGGSHRSWDIDIAEGVVRFAFINRSKVQIVTQPARFSKFKCYGTVSHGAEIHAAVITKQQYIITASEDCTLILHTADSARQFSSHISSVRSLCISDDILFSAGGRGSLKAWAVTTAADLELKCDYSVVSNTHIPVGYNSSYRFDQRNNDNDQRVLSVACALSPDPSYLCHVVCGLSNGSVYLLGYSDSNSFVRLLEVVLNNCITKVMLSGCNQESLTIFATTTFGMVHGTDINIPDYSIQNSFSTRHHSSGINGLDISQSCLLTIGDDGDVVKSSLHPESGITVTARRTAHFSAGISVRFLGLTHFVTVGSDQRLVVCRLSDLEPVFCCYVDVPDPHDLVLSCSEDGNLRTALVCGKGFQEYHLAGL